ncbi:MAG TPA: hypothetical protein VGV35_02745 [Bryobacteraceae bacterium]|nr:hypothetical protein [Bryobacteraceae bacterium]
MHVRTLMITAGAFTAMAGALSAQTFQRRAALTGGGSPGVGECVVEVVVDGAAEIEIRGDNAQLRNLSGQAPQWRRFECSSPMPVNPGFFSFRGTDGRGDQELVRDPRKGGSAVVRIEDPESGAGVYRFQLTWNNGGGYPGAPVNRRNEWNRTTENGYYRDNGYRQFTQQDALRVCQNSVREQAMERFHTGNLQFRTTAATNPDRPDWISGTLQIQGDYGRDDWYQFGCSVDYDTGRVRNTQIDPMEPPRGGRELGRYPGSNAVNGPATQSCERAATQRLRRDGYTGIQFGAIRVEDRPGGSDVVLGDLTANGQYGVESFSFSCSVRLESGEVRSVDVTRR